jgi:hypothetical protein
VKTQVAPGPATTRGRLPVSDYMCPAGVVHHMMILTPGPDGLRAATHPAAYRSCAQNCPGCPTVTQREPSHSANVSGLGTSSENWPASALPDLLLTIEVHAGR